MSDYITSQLVDCLPQEQDIHYRHHIDRHRTVPKQLLKQLHHYTALQQSVFFHILLDLGLRQISWDALHYAAQEKP